jgi:hypothetical protein
LTYTGTRWGKREIELKRERDRERQREREREREKEAGKHEENGHGRNDYIPRCTRGLQTRDRQNNK